MLARVLGLVSLLVVDSAGAADLQIVCPCLMSEVSQTSFGVTVGITNRDANQTGETSGDLRLRIAAGPVPSIFDASTQSVGRIYLQIPLAPGESNAGTLHKTGFVAPTDGDSYINLLLEEDVGGSWAIRDILRMRQMLSSTREGGHSVSGGTETTRGHVFFDGDPTLVVDGGEATLSLPAVHNVSPDTTTGNLRLQIRQAAGDSVFGFSYVVPVAAEEDLATTLAPGTSIAARETTFAFTESGSGGFDWFHLTLLDESTDPASVLAWQTLRVNGGTPAMRSFALSGIEILEDDDVDGVGNFNERLVGTDPTNDSDKPGPSVVDVIIFYADNVGAVYGGDATARIDHIIEATNMFYADSGVNLTFREVAREEVSMDNDTSNSAILGLMRDELAPFENLAVRKVAVGADIAVTLRADTGTSTNCGIANLGGPGSSGDFSFTGVGLKANTALFIDCRDNVLAHEAGHIMGLTHSRVESRRLNKEGTFPWSVGYGIDGSFVTIMASWDDFGGDSVPELNLFAGPALTCEGSACGVAATDAVDGADAVRSLEIVRYQVERFTTPVTSSGGDDDGDATTGALMLSLDGSLVAGTFSNSTDADYFAVAATIGRTYTFATSSLGAGIDTQLALLDTDGETILASATAAGVSNLPFVATANGRLYLRVIDAGGKAGTYNVGVAETSPLLLDAGVVLVASVLPSSRSVQIGTTATAFVTVINGGSSAAEGCTIVPDTALPIDYFYQQTDPLSNATVGARNTPVDLAAGAAQSFVIGVTPLQAFASTELGLRYICDDSLPATPIAGLNTLRISTSLDPIPDVVALAATVDDDGIVHIPGTSGTSFFSMATVNVGISSELTVTADTGGVTLPVTVSMCESNPATGACINPLVPTTEPVVTTIDANGTPTFSIFVTGSDLIEADAAAKRIFVRFKDAGEVVRGSTSVAVQTD